MKGSRQSSLGKPAERVRDHSQSPSRILWDKGLIINLTFCAPFLVVAATTLKNGVALSLAMTVVLVPTVILSLILRQKLHCPYWLGTPVWTMAAMFLASLSYYVIRYVSVEITDSLGIYLYLLASAAVVSAVFTGKRISTVPAAGAWALRYSAGFAMAALIISAIREVLAYGTLWGVNLPEPLRLEGAAMPFFGLIMFGAFSAGYQWIRRLLTEFRQARAEREALEAEGGELL
jgi:electron transport complex protein RnfE